MGVRATIVVETHLGKLCVCPKLCIRSVLSAAVGSLFSLANSNGVAHRTGFRICCSLAGLARLCLLRASVPCLGNFKCRDIIADRDCIADNKYLWYFFGCLKPFAPSGFDCSHVALASSSSTEAMSGRTLPEGWTEEERESPVFEWRCLGMLVSTRTSMPAGRNWGLVVGRRLGRWV